VRHARCGVIRDLPQEGLVGAGVEEEPGDVASLPVLHRVRSPRAERGSGCLGEESGVAGDLVDHCDGLAAGELGGEDPACGAVEAREDDPLVHGGGSSPGHGSTVPRGTDRSGWRPNARR